MDFKTCIERGLRLDEPAVDLIATRAQARKLGRELGERRALAIPSPVVVEDH